MLNIYSGSLPIAVISVMPKIRKFCLFSINFVSHRLCSQSNMSLSSYHGLLGKSIPCWDCTEYDVIYYVASVYAGGGL